MKTNYQIATILFLCSLSLISCSTKNVCIEELQTNYPEILEYIDSLELKNMESWKCSRTESLGSKMLYGITEKNSNGYFYKDSCGFENLSVREFTFEIKRNSKYSDQISFSAYEFLNEQDLQKFENCYKSISRQMTQSKEINHFFKKNGKWFLYYEGFP